MYKKTKAMSILGPTFFFLGLGIIVWQTTLWVGLGLFMLIIGTGINIKNREITSEEEKDAKQQGVGYGG